MRPVTCHRPPASVVVDRPPPLTIAPAMAWPLDAVRTTPSTPPPAATVVPEGARVRVGVTVGSGGDVGSGVAVAETGTSVAVGTRTTSVGEGPTGGTTMSSDGRGGRT